MGFFNRIINDAHPSRIAKQRSAAPEPLAVANDKGVVPEHENSRPPNRGEVETREVREEGLTPREVRISEDNVQTFNSTEESVNDPLLVESDGVTAESPSKMHEPLNMVSSDDFIVVDEAWKQEIAKSSESTVSSESKIRSNLRSAVVSGSSDRKKELNNNLEISDRTVNESIEPSKTFISENSDEETWRTLRQETGQRTPPKHLFKSDGSNSAPEFDAESNHQNVEKQPAHQLAQVASLDDILSSAEAFGAPEVKMAREAVAVSQEALAAPVIAKASPSQEPAQPRVHIGQVDVVITAPEPAPAPHAAPKPTMANFASKNILRRL